MKIVGHVGHLPFCTPLSIDIPHFFVAHSQWDTA